jgi:hypothetical protein
VGREVRFECKMASFEGESARVIDKFNGENFNLWKFKIVENNRIRGETAH